MKNISYKHELVMADELLKANAKNVPVMMLYDEFPAYRNKNNQIICQVAKFPEAFVINRIEIAGGSSEDTYVYVYYFDKVKKQNTYSQVHHAVQFAKLTGTKAKDLIMEEMESQFESLEKNLGHAFKVGSDPEIFVEDDEGKCIPAFDFLGSKTDKKNQFECPYGPMNIYWDGFQAEFETVALNCLEQHSASVQYGLQELLKLAKKHNSKARLSTKTVMRIDAEELSKAKLEHVSLGCMPSFNAYGMSGDPVEDPRLLPIRPAGGHIHFGIGKSTHEQVKDMVKALDAILGVCCVSLFQNYDEAVRRRYYGLAGEYRLPPHGLEYRTLSNAWLYHPVIMNFVFDLARKVLVFGQKGFLPKWNASEAETIACINNCDVTLAHEIMDRNKDIIIKLFKAAYPEWEGKNLEVYEALYKIFYKGMDCIVADSKDFYKNWNMGNSLYSYSDKMPRNFRHNIDTIIQIGKKVA